MLNLALTLLEGAVLVAAALGLHRIRSRFGLAPLLAYLSGLVVQAQVANYSYVIGGGLVINGAVLMIGVVFLSVLILHGADGAVAAAQAATAVMGLSLLVFFVGLFNRLRAALGGGALVPIVPGQAILPLNPALILCSIGALLLGLTTLLSVHARLRRTPTLAVLAALVAGLAVDSLAFNVLFGLTSSGGVMFGSRFARDLSNKVALSLLLWPVAAIYLARHGRPHHEIDSDRSLLEVLFGPAARIETELLDTRGALRQERDLVTGLAETSPVGILRFDREGRLVFANGESERILGERASELQGRQETSPAWRFADEHGARVGLGMLSFAKVRESGQPVRGVRLSLERPDGARVSVTLNAAPLHDVSGRVAGIVATLDDVSEQRRAELDREKLIRELESKNAELERFTYTVSHDLRSPLITIRGFLGQLALAMESGDRARFEADRGRISQATDKMEALLRELLELSRVGRVVGTSQTLELADVVRAAAEQVHGALAAGGVRVTLAPDLPRVFGDRNRLVELFQNLIDNAAKFMGAQPAPTIEVGWRPADPPVVFVKDNGVGIEARHLERVFGLFDKLDPKSEGSGVGLAIVKRIVEVHGGRVWVESAGPGCGSTFCLVLGSVSR